MQNRLGVVKLLLEHNINAEELTKEEELDALDLAEKKVGRSLICPADSR